MQFLLSSISYLRVCCLILRCLNFPLFLCCYFITCDWRSYFVWFKPFKIYWDCFCGCTCGLYWRLFCIHLKRCIFCCCWMKCSVCFYKIELAFMLFKSTFLINLPSSCSTYYWMFGIAVSNYYCGTVYFSLQFCQFCLHIF